MKQDGLHPGQVQVAHTHTQEDRNLLRLASAIGLLQLGREPGLGELIVLVM